MKRVELRGGEKGGEGGGGKGELNWEGFWNEGAKYKESCTASGKNLLKPL